MAKLVKDPLASITARRRFMAVGQTTISGWMPPPPVTLRPLSVRNSLCSLGCAVVAASSNREASSGFLDGAAAGRVIEGRGERQAGVLAQRVDALHQALAVAGLAEDDGAVVILHGAGDDLGGAGGFAFTRIASLNP